MRKRRLKPSGRASWHHCYNRVAGAVRDRPLGPEERAVFLQIAQRLSELYTIEVVAFCVLGNHFHLLVWVPGEEPSAGEVCRRYARFYRGRRRIREGSRRCREWQKRCRDLSWYMRHLEQMFAVWYNGSRGVGRRGSVWAGRYRNTLVEGAEGVWRCWLYVEGNGVRAGLARRGSGYRYCTLGRREGWVRMERLVEAVGELAGVRTVEELRRLGDEIVSERAGWLGVEGRYWVNGRVVGRYEHVVVAVKGGRGPPVRLTEGLYAACACRRWAV